MPAGEPAPSLRRQVVATFVIAALIGMTASLFRASTAVVALDVLADLKLGTAWAAYMTSAYFLAATLFQIPAGVIFDRFGLTRTIPPMLILASAGALVVALSGSGPELIAGRLLMGIGCGAVTTGGVVLCSKWVGPARFTSVVAALYALSQLGYLGSTTPMALLANRVGWRGAFLAMAGGALLLALAHIALVRERPPKSIGTRQESFGLRETVAGSLAILGDRRLRRIYAMAFVSYAAGFSIIGVWGSLYFHDVYGLDLVASGNILLVMVAAYAGGLYAFGWIGQRLGRQKPAIMAGMAVACAIMITVSVASTPPLAVVVTLFIILGAASGSSSMLTVHGFAFYPPAAIGRGMTVLNIVVLAGSLTFHVVTGALMDVLTGLGVPSGPAFRILFATHAICLLVGLLFYRRSRERPEA
jgi:MFS family permease